MSEIFSAIATGLLSYVALSFLTLASPLPPKFGLSGAARIWVGTLATAAVCVLLCSWLGGKPGFEGAAIGAGLIVVYLGDRRSTTHTQGAQ